ncbi:serine/threonine protein kinase [Streptomyces zinciresistens K42]|uniref:non-specific serine/threonine protein kinase n=1 Tax=Streptomyces zinciresistens K42 TaxID=700597 RepID=G2GIK3_9ACTN|nr:serine/threonine-protein kinase [Streptomyces zinciresistens]EGX56663.1 serine/threonine protein kinase [Streptomyces zinciresistens K42]
MRPADRDNDSATGPYPSGRVVAGRYLLHDMIGRGGMGTVWRAHDQLLDRPVAAKEMHLHSGGAEDPKVRMRRAVREARAVARVPHPHVVAVHDLVEAEDRLWIVMELVDGPSLGHHVAANGPLPPQHTAALGVQILDALGAVHAAGTLHRDVKPANVLLRRSGDAVITDFGIAALDDGEFLTTTGELVGSLDYMAPERVTDDPVGPASDLWSLGATLATVCTGRSPFRKQGRPATLHAVAYEEPLLDDRIGPLRPVVEAMLRKRPEERPSAADLRAALLHVAQDQRTGPLPSAPVAVEWPSPTEADARTMTYEGLSGALTETALHTAAPHTATQDGTRPDHGRRPPGQRWLWWAIGGVSVVVAGAAGTLLLSGASASDARAGGKPTAPASPSRGSGSGAGVPQPAPSSPPAPSPTTLTKVVDSTSGWQTVDGAAVRSGDQVTVAFRSGGWSVDYNRLPDSGPDGYDPETAKQLEGAESCKVLADSPFGALLVTVDGPENPRVRPVGKGLSFQAAEDGTVALTVNDTTGSCSTDNRGSMTVTVTVTPAT